MNEYNEIRNLYFDKMGNSKLSNEDAKDPFLRKNLLELYHYLQLSKDCSPEVLNNIAKYLSQQNIIPSTSNNTSNNKIKELEECVYKMVEKAEKKKSESTGHGTSFIGHEPDYDSPSYKTFHEKSVRNSILNDFFQGVNVYIQNKDNLSEQELSHIQQLTCQITSLAIETEHNDIAQKLIKIIALGNLETDTCTIDGKINLVKDYLIGVVTYYAKEKNNYRKTGSSRRDRTTASKQENSMHIQFKDVVDDLASGAYGKELKQDREFRSSLEDKFTNYGKSFSHSGYLRTFD